MKNIQIIDGAMNCSYDIYAARDEEFTIIFHELEQDIEFIEYLIARNDRVTIDRIMQKIWSRPIDKRTVRGIHGTLFYDLEYKKSFYPDKRSDKTSSGI